MTCKCGFDTNGTGAKCPACHKYDTSEYVLIDSKPPRVLALEAQNAEMLAMLKEIVNSGEIPYCESSHLVLRAKALIKKVEGENGK